MTPADAIIVIDGEYPFRVLEAIDLYHAGLGKEIWLPSEAERRKIIDFFQNQSDFSSVLFKNIESHDKPLPMDALKIRPRSGQDTKDELQSLARQSGEYGITTAILVTTDFHSRRVRHLASRIMQPETKVLVTWSKYQHVFKRDDWWKIGWYRRITVAELLKLTLQWLV